MDVIDPQSFFVGVLTGWAITSTVMIIIFRPQRKP